MREVLLNIEAIEDDGASLGVADVITFRATQQPGVLHFEAVWPVIDEWRVITVNRMRIDGRMVDLEQPVQVACGDTLRIRGMCAAQWAGGGKCNG